MFQIAKSLLQYAVISDSRSQSWRTFIQSIMIPTQQFVLSHSDCLCIAEFMVCTKITCSLRASAKANQQGGKDVIMQIPANVNTLCFWSLEVKAKSLIGKNKKEFEFLLLSSVLNSYQGNLDNTNRLIQIKLHQK